METKPRPERNTVEQVPDERVGVGPIAPVSLAHWNRLVYLAMRATAHCPEDLAEAIRKATKP
jgi:hypothetical protein